MKKRVFISIDVPEEIQKKIIMIQKKLPVFSGNKTKPENLHLTLKFLGELDEQQIIEVKNKLKKIKVKQFETKLKSIGVFSKSYIRIIWLHLTNCDILQKDVDNSVYPMFEKESRFMSHLTIARVKSVYNKKKFLEDLKTIELPEIKFVVNNFRLKESVLTPQGPVYSIIEEYYTEE